VRGKGDGKFVFPPHGSIGWLDDIKKKRACISFFDELFTCSSIMATNTKYVMYSLVN
jgi:hypothetical protein